jgi:sugar/nucleoside kinase (ribokinase family)
MSVLVVGSVAIDDVRTPDGHGANVLGGSASYFSLSARQFAPVSIVAVVGEDFPRSHLDLLSDAGVGISGVDVRPGESFFWAGSYGKALKQATTHETRLGVFETFDPELSEAERDTPFVFLANIDPDLQLKVLDQVRKPQLVVLDTMNLWLDIKRESVDRVISRVDIAVVNDEELELLTGDSNLLRASAALLERGPRAVVIKKGANGAFIRSRDDYFTLPAYPTDRVTDPTGAGDTFAGGFVGYLAAGGDVTSSSLRGAMARGIAMASFTVESFSVERLHAVQPAEIEKRVARLREITSFD